MENGKTETEEKMEGEPEDKGENMEEADLDIAQLQSLVTELQEGLHGALMELCQLRHRDHDLEDELKAHQTDVDNKIMGLKNSLNTLKEELNVALFHIKGVSSRQQEVLKRIELLQPGNTQDIISVSHRSRKSSMAEVLATSEDDHICAANQSDLSVIQHFFSSLPPTASSQRTATSTQTCTFEQETQQQQRGCPSRSPAWAERKNSRDETGTHTSLTESSNRQRVALDLLESERVYVSHLSLLLKANISFNGSEALTCKDKRPFPSSLRFLIQQHLELLHTLQERVLKCQWQGIMGDVFMRLTSKEGEFLDLYVSYLKELPECLMVISMLASNSMTSSALMESDITGGESKPSLHNLLLQPVQRIPEYLLLLQGLLRQTEAEHPDYYLLLVCIQQFRSFTTQYQHLLQHNQELLLFNRKRCNMKQLLKTVESGIQANNMGSPYPCSDAMQEHANQVKRSKQRLLEQIQSHCFKDWDREPDPETHCFGIEWPSQLPYFSPDLDSRNHKSQGLGSIPENEASVRSMSCQHHLPSRPAEGRQVQPGSALADALGEFLLPPDPSGTESLYEEDRGSFHDVSMFDRCSSASSDSSIDIAFVKCPKGPSASHNAMAVNVLTNRDVFGNSRSHGKKTPNRGCVSPDESIIMHHSRHRPLQVSQRKSKSLNGLQMDNPLGGLDGGPLPDNFQKAGVGGHAKLERQGSKGSKGSSTPSRRVQSSPGTRVDSDKHGDDLHGPLSISHQDPEFQSWEESKWRGGTEEYNHTPLSERSRKQDKGGFRSSFKKLFKKKSGDEKKEKGAEKTPDNQNDGEHESLGQSSKVLHLEINRGTAV